MCGDWIRDVSKRPSELKLVAFAPLLALLVLAAVLRAPTLRGPGYALDEEITVFAVRGIQHVGLPLFPSGVLSDRGLPFSYAAWSAGLIFGQELTSYRLVSFLSGIVAVLILYFVTQRLAGRVAAVAAALLLAIFPLHIAISGWARFYAAAAAALTVSIALFYASERHPRYRPWFVVSVVAGFLLHELCVVLIALPLISMGYRWKQTLVWCVAGVFLARLALIGLHFVVPNQQLNPWLYQGASIAAPSRLQAAFVPVSLSGGYLLVVIGIIAAAAYAAMVRRRKAPPIFLLVCVVTAVLFQLGALIAATLLAVLVRPARWTIYLRLAGATAVASAVFWTLHTAWVTNAGLTIELFRSLAVYSASYPLEGAMFFARSLPVTSLAAAAVLIATLRSSSEWREQQMRLLLAVIVLSLLLISALNLASNSRYYLVTWTVVLIVAAYAVERLWRRRWLGRAAAIALTAILAMEHRAYSHQNPVLATGSIPPLGTVERVTANGWPEVLSRIPENAVVISNDELAAAYHIGRVDYWLTTSEWDLARYELVTDSGRYGEYAGANVISTADDLRSITDRRGGRPTVFVLFRTGRFEYDRYRQLVLDVLPPDQRAAIEERSGIFVARLRDGR
jgi:hypothetical protein